MSDNRIRRNAPPSVKGAANKPTARSEAKTLADLPSVKQGWAPKNKAANRPSGSGKAVALNVPAAPAQVAAATKTGQAPAVAAEMNREIAQAISFRHRGNDIPESLLPTDHPPVEGNKVDLLVDGPQVFPQILKDLSNAKDSIHISHFAVGNDTLGQEMGKILMDKAKQGVEVRVLVEPLGSGDLLHRGGTEDMLEQWEKAGVQVIRNYEIDPARKAEMLNHVDHQKMYVIDGKVAYTGGMGIQEKYRSEWHDTMVRVEGEGARQEQVDFIKKWQHLGGRIDQKGGTDDELKARFFPEAGRPGNVTVQGRVAIPGESHPIRDAYLNEINSAQKTLTVENPYLTDQRIIDALANAAKRGVDVKVVVPGKTDNPLTLWAARGHYDALLKAGVHIYEYPKMTHTKMAARDGQWATFGSSNLDSLSMNHNYEFNFQTSDKGFATQTQEMISHDAAISKEMKPGDVSGLPKLLDKVLDNRILSYFL